MQIKRMYADFKCFFPRQEEMQPLKTNDAHHFFENLKRQNHFSTVTYRILTVFADWNVSLVPLCSGSSVLRDVLKGIDIKVDIEVHAEAETVAKVEAEIDAEVDIQIEVERDLAVKVEKVGR